MIGEGLADVLAYPDRHAIILAPHVAKAIGCEDLIFGPRVSVAAVFPHADRLTFLDPMPERRVIDQFPISFICRPLHAAGARDRAGRLESPRDMISLPRRRPAFRHRRLAASPTSPAGCSRSYHRTGPLD